MILLNSEIKYINVAPYLDNTTFKKQIEECCLWLHSELGIPLRGRIQEYQKHIKWYERNRGNFNDNMYYCLQAFFEMNQIVEVHKYLSDLSTKDFLSTIKKAVHGQAFKDKIAKNGDDHARNFLFELIVATELKKTEINDLDLTQRADIISDKFKSVIECKRVQSEIQIIPNVKDAISQSKNDMLTYEDLFVFIDITEIHPSSKSIITINETGFPFSLIPPTSETELNEKFTDQMKLLVSTIAHPTLLNDLKKLCQKKTFGIVLNYNAIGFHVNIAQERLAVANLKYFIPNSEKNLDQIKEILNGYFMNFTTITE